METKIAIQGIKGSFHHQVAGEYFGDDVTLEECMSFPVLVQSLVQSRTGLGIMALENSIAGSIIPNYALIDHNNLHIIGEHILNIHMNLMALEGQTVADIKEIHSHPMALLQCSEFFAKYPDIKLVESADTAESARLIREGNLKGIAAVGSPIAAQMFGLSILAAGIHNIKNNQTRFVIIKTQNKAIPKEEINKASIKFELDDTPGSLATVLNVMNNCKLNLTKIQSMPIAETPFKYSFFVDVTFEKYKHYEKAKAIVELMTTHFKVLGEYKKGKA
ncbi:prephenate dehydratase [Flavobacterium subsaxonicum]|uniref:prephenate dehydratase n=1 Tax=Flavobacterium subsaxonicum WB 4.1-42 = DSM 21790 TaxID=1121898 RepID=A0A0A2MPH0_9FLAO|nr:prephenate dehydratase [Flavobacterium subsaxonicum]KGO94184.1 prephenate dehydratase [Flavobacterium subsaxonicum WB 4.1-42 = DSM 21790]